MFEESSFLERTDKSLALDSRIKDLKSNVASQFNDLREIPYRLQSVFIHRGYHNSGHYWIYIYDFSKHLWRKYNDGYVTEVKDTNVIFQQEPGDRPATPYFLVYVRDESKEDLVDSVCRDVVEPPPEERVDTPMEECFQATEGHSEASTYRPIDSSMDHETTGSYEWPQDPTWDRVWNASEASTYTQW